MPVHRLLGTHRDRVLAYFSSGHHASPGDYADEAPLRDARGFEMGRSVADASQLTDEEDPTLANVVLTNGARLYVDHAQPEYSSPEVTSPRAAIAFDRAGEAILAEAGPLTRQELGEALVEAGIRLKGRAAAHLQLLAVLRGATGPAELAEEPGIGTSGQIYHHIRTLTAAGWLRASGRGQVQVPAERVVPLLVALATTL